MWDASESDDPNSGGNVGYALSILVGTGLGYWGYTLDRQGAGETIPLLPAILAVGALTIAFFVTGIVTRNESYGWSLFLGGVLLPVVFVSAMNIFQALM